MGKQVNITLKNMTSFSLHIVTFCVVEWLLRAKPLLGRESPNCCLPMPCPGWLEQMSFTMYLIVMLKEQCNNEIRLYWDLRAVINFSNRTQSVCLAHSVIFNMSSSSLGIGLGVVFGVFLVAAVFALIQRGAFTQLYAWLVNLPTQKEQGSPVDSEEDCSGPEQPCEISCIISEEKSSSGRCTPEEANEDLESNSSRTSRHGITVVIIIPTKGAAPIFCF